ncbi:MAG TPA: hypothetical protein DD727_00075 [Clostridiales bacterium]|nr:hypothetical protein [Clostridiales bacterium]
MARVASLKAARAARAGVPEVRQALGQQAGRFIRMAGDRASLYIRAEIGRHLQPVYGTFPRPPQPACLL